ncbi:efflux RND transporter periplasmic adaptor subunit, partial [Hydrogenophaga sp.]|uniref:efflux RND transporter periplasmic adaptor subunit n=1 Tax=Hydrogenophaga sp. TaxID=1904254 RepID=UPI003565EA52
LQPGARVVAQTPALAGQSFEGRVAALLPQVNPKTRTLKVRMEIANPRGQLVPGMFVQMELAGQATERAVLVPTEAVIQTGKRSLVMLAEEQGRFRPVEVEIGTESGGQTEIRRGLTAGQRVVLSGQFLIDSEASLKGVEARLNPGQSALEPQPETTAAAVHTTRARIEAMDGKTLTLSHPPIPSLRWPAMRMDFQLAPKLSPSTLAVGQTVEIEFRMQDGEVPLIESLRRDEAAPAVGGLK